ncbi:MAG: DUF5069 domain-containing protein [Candidatus Eremiobacteraeota bacterium]|nr:DUF5069 domain-containing protein [Candidatus Eremiobacteraeota bacterium]
MEPLDLTKMPPRAPRLEVDGLAYLPRTIDKLRATLPGGNRGLYNLEGWSRRMMDAVGVTEEQMLAAVASAQSDEEVAAWLHAHARMEKYAEFTSYIFNYRVCDARANDPQGYPQRYPIAAERPDIVYHADLLVADDQALFSKR